MAGLISEYKIATVDGKSYAESTENYVRLSLTKDTDVLMQVADGLRRYDGEFFSLVLLQGPR